jgi:hypothetical protein
MNSSEEEEATLPIPYDYDQESQSLFDRDNASDITAATTAFSELESPLSAQALTLIPYCYPSPAIPKIPPLPYSL